MSLTRRSQGQDVEATDADADADGVAMVVSRDAFLDGRVSILQPKVGHRAGIDAVLLAASVRAGGADGETILDVGAGPGTVGLLVAARIRQARVRCVEIEPELVELGWENIKENGFEGRIGMIEADVLLPFAQLEARGFKANRFDQVVSNPPYYDEDRCRVSEVDLRRQANSFPSGGLERWVKFMTTSLRADGLVTVIFPADRLDDLIVHLKGRFGGLEIFPIFPREGGQALRVLVRGRKGSRAPIRLYGGLVMHEADGSFTVRANGILSEGAALDFEGI